MSIKRPYSWNAKINLLYNKSKWKSLINIHNDTSGFFPWRQIILECPHLKLAISLYSLSKSNTLCSFPHSFIFVIRWNFHSHGIKFKRYKEYTVKTLPLTYHVANLFLSPEATCVSFPSRDSVSSTISFSK